MRPHALVLVFGDVGHSPRMQNHARQLLEEGYTVDFAGYAESELPQDLQKETLRVVPLPVLRLSWSLVPQAVLRVLNAVVGVLFGTAWTVWVGMRRVRRPDVIVVQTPPVLPTLIAGSVLAWWHQSRYLVDWHNIGYTVLAQTRRPLPAVVAVAKGVELALARLAPINLTVSRAMQSWLEINAGVSSVVLFDRPNKKRFAPLPAAERRAFRQRLRERLGWESREREGDAPIVVSSTSWTADENFELLVAALQIVDARAAAPVQVLITGKGPLRAHYESLLVALDLQKIQFATLWLSAEDYSRLLASSDVGVCLHTSSSGLDLPMKAIDMLGAGLPVVAVRYPAIDELIVEGENGFLFDTPEELAAILQDVLAGSRVLAPRPMESWAAHWRATVAPLLSK